MLLRLGLCPHNMGKQTNGVAFVTTSLSLVPRKKICSNQPDMFRWGKIKTGSLTVAWHTTFPKTKRIRGETEEIIQFMAQTSVTINYSGRSNLYHFHCTISQKQLTADLEVKYHLQCHNVKIPNLTFPSNFEKSAMNTIFLAH